MSLPLDARFHVWNFVPGVLVLDNANIRLTPSTRLLGGSRQIHSGRASDIFTLRTINRRWGIGGSLSFTATSPGGSASALIATLHTAPDGRHSVSTSPGRGFVAIARSAPVVSGAGIITVTFGVWFLGGIPRNMTGVSAAVGSNEGDREVTVKLPEEEGGKWWDPEIEDGDEWEPSGAPLEEDDGLNTVTKATDRI